MSDTQEWTIVIAALVIVAVALLVTLTFLRRVIERRMDQLDEKLEMFFSAHDRRQETLELQRASIETRLASIEVRLTSIDIRNDVLDSIEPIE